MSDWLLMQVLARIERKLDSLIQKENTQIASIDDLVNAVHNQTTVVAGVDALLNTLKQQIADALGGTITAEQQAKLDSAFAEVTANTQNLSDAIVANTPAASGNA